MAQQRYRLVCFSPYFGADILDGQTVVASVSYIGDRSKVEELRRRIVDALNESENIERFNSGDIDRCPTCGNRVDADGFPLRTE